MVSASLTVKLLFQGRGTKRQTVSCVPLLFMMSSDVLTPGKAISRTQKAVTAARHCLFLAFFAKHAGSTSKLTPTRHLGELAGAADGVEVVGVLEAVLDAPKVLLPARHAVPVHLQV